jgi:nitroimidazol reductase NimA-like FMN-containing flavoprotein (pyridoxamine 5'-phosphate oxidase superfamily)
MTNLDIPQTPRTTLKRYPHLAVYDRAKVYAILDDGYMCTVAYVHEDSPRVLPTGYGRIGDFIYIHGSNASTMLGAVLSSSEVCISVAHIDGLVLGRSLFHHTPNFRSVVIYGRAERVADLDEKRASFKAYADRFLPGRYDDVRPPSEKELNGVTVVRIPLREAVAKVRSGPIIDSNDDLDRECWSGVMLIKQTVSGLIRDPKCRPDIPLPSYIKDFERLPSKGILPTASPL